VRVDEAAELVSAAIDAAAPEGPAVLVAIDGPGGAGKSGYYYAATGAATGGATYNTSFVIGAAPIVVHSTGNRDFCQTNDGVLRSQMGSVGDLPAGATSACLAYPVAQ